MKTFWVREQLLYRVEARDEEAAVQHVIDDGKRDKHCLAGVEERWAVETEESLKA